MKSSTRIVLAFIIGLFLGVVIPIINGMGLLLALQSGFIFAILVAIIVSMLSWGIDIAMSKGYPDWAGFFLVFFLNIFGLLLLAILPNKAKLLTGLSK